MFCFRLVHPSKSFCNSSRCNISSTSVNKEEKEVINNEFQQSSGNPSSSQLDNSADNGQNSHMKEYSKNKEGFHDFLSSFGLQLPKHLQQSESVFTRVSTLDNGIRVASEPCNGTHCTLGGNKQF